MHSGVQYPMDTRTGWSQAITGGIRTEQTEGDAGQGGFTGTQQSACDWPMAGAQGRSVRPQLHDSQVNIKNTVQSKSKRIWIQLRKLNSGILITLKELLSNEPIYMAKMDKQIGNIIKFHSIYVKMSSQIDSNDYLYHALLSNNDHNEGLITIIDQLMTAKLMNQVIAPNPQLPAPVPDNKDYDKKYGTAYDFSTIRVPKRGERAPPPTYLHQPRPQNALQAPQTVPSFNKKVNIGRQSRDPAP